VITRLLALLILSGCFRVHHSPACDESATEVTDAEVTPAGAAIDLLAVVTGDGQSEALLADGSEVDVAWSVARGEGSARWVESEHSTHTERSFGFGSSTQLNIVFCEDRLEAPVVATLVSESGDVDVTVVTVAESLTGERQGVDPNVDGQSDFENATLPTDLGVNPDDFSDKTAFLFLDRLGSAEVSGSAGWEGTRETETAIERRAEVLVEFPLAAL
jgi:hypothetical protein